MLQTKAAEKNETYLMTKKNSMSYGFQDKWTEEGTQCQDCYTVSTLCDTLLHWEQLNSMLTSCEWLIQTAQHADKLWVAHTARTAC